MNRLKMFFLQEDGATAIEYSLVGSMMAITAIVAAKALGGSVSDLFSLKISAKVNNFDPVTPPPSNP